VNTLLVSILVSIFLTILFISLATNAVLAYFLFQASKRYEALSDAYEENEVDKVIVENIQEITDVILEYGRALEQINEMDVYMGDPTIENLINRTRILSQDIDSYSKIQQKNLQKES
jgi:hypothetical protein